ncbi:hypothetical protein PCS_01991 [Desulfocurvibacter africanus PCS]|uniref:Uncharacterized protein n=1 Tax=Desulfocurvibacter africanus PCS TaxID=1262666 RepID=M5PSY2_DESAF|nr:hypothetical protein [Desulfocurvibacter africanus]EMG37155.1 hypothetical protein PCS_01991 [Desulfocurvibacter africanus PCS]
MAKHIKIDDYISDPTPLVDALNKIAKKLGESRPSDIPLEKIIQYNEISKTIDRLKEAGADIPDELRRLKLDLAKQADEHKIATESWKVSLQTLQTLEGRISHSLVSVRAIITRISDKPGSKSRQKRFVKRSSPALLSRELRKALRELGGSGKKADVLERIRINMDGKFKPQDLERDAQGNLNWEKWIVAEKNRLVKEGAIVTGSSFGVWELRRK